MPVTVVTDRGPNTGHARDKVMGARGDQDRVSTSRLLGPDEQVVGEGDKMREGRDSGECPGAQMLDVMDVAGRGEEGRDGGALIVQRAETGHPPLRRGKGGREEGIVNRSLCLIERINKTALAIPRGDLAAVDGVGDGHPVLDRERESRTGRTFRGHRLEDDKARVGA